MAEILPGEYEALVAVDRLAQHPRNERRGNVGRIEHLISANGFHGAAGVWRPTDWTSGVIERTLRGERS